MNPSSTFHLNKFMDISQILKLTKDRLDIISSRNSEEIRSKHGDLLKIEIRHEDQDME